MAKNKMSKRAEKIVESQYSNKSEQYKALAKQYYTLAHRADARMRELEKLSTQEGYTNVLKYAYKKAQYNLHGGTRFEKTLFKTNEKGEKITISYQSLEKRVRDINTFLDSVSSTKSGIEKVYKKRAKTINKNNGTNLTWEDIERAVNEGIFDKLKQYGSDTMFITIDLVKNGDSDILEALKEGKKHEMLPDEVAQNRIKEALADNNIEWETLNPNFKWEDIGK